MSANWLPPEIWLQIFRWATSASSSHELYAVSYEPFQTSTTHAESLDRSLRVKLTLVLVCRQWRALAAEFLYEDVRIRHGDQELQNVLARTASEANTGYGRWVRRIELPYANTVTTTPSPLVSIDILKRCPQIEVLVRPGSYYELENLRFEFSADTLPLTSLKRLEWWHHNDAARSGGINSLDNVLRCTPNLTYLSITGELSLNLIRMAPLHLPVLETLRLRRMNGLFIRQICRWWFPALVHVLVDAPVSASALESLWETFGPQLHTVELCQSLRFLTDNYLPGLLAGCTGLRELYYHVHFTTPPHSLLAHATLERVGLYDEGNMRFYEADWEHLEEHFALLSGVAFPALKQVVLYGGWHRIICDARFASLKQGVLDRHCVLQLADGFVIS